MKTRKKSTATVLQNLKAAAEVAFHNAYSPYSNVKVGAAVMGANGKIYAGCNVENASFGATICAERAAILCAVSDGEKEINSVLILTAAANPWPPCGMCRQVLLEFASLAVTVYLVSLKGKVVKTSMARLCPQSFSRKMMRSRPRLSRAIGRDKLTFVRHAKP